MSERVQLHIANWMKQLELPATVELRYRTEVVDSVLVEENSPFEALACELYDSAEQDAITEGKSRKYTLIAITSKDERYVCPITIQHRIDKTAVDLVTALS